MLIKGFDVGPAAIKEIESMLEEHGEYCVSFLEQKFDVLIIPGDQVEVYQLPETEEV